VTREEAMRRMKKFVVIVGVSVLVAAGFLGLILEKAIAAEASSTGSETVAKAVQTEPQTPEMLKYKGMIVISIGILVGAGSLGAAYAVASVGSAALGAVTERPEIMGRALIFVALAEGIAIYGLLMAFLLMRQLG